MGRVNCFLLLQPNSRSRTPPSLVKHKLRKEKIANPRRKCCREFKKLKLEEKKNWSLS
jgi:hypothetical protein